MAVADQKQSQCPTVSSPKKRRRPAKTMGKLLLKKVPGFNQMADKQAVNNKNLQGPKRLKRATVDSLYDTFEAQSCVLEQAKEIQANLEPEFHSLVKTMLPSNVTGGFWLGLPKHFCRAHLPMQDTAIVLEDESGEAFETKYLAEKVGLSAGWRGFSISHKLMEGDIVVFHLVKPSKFKVYIVRSNGSDEVDGALALLKLDAGMKLMKYDKDTKACEEPVYEALKTLSQENTQKNSIMVCVTDPGPMVDLSEDDSDIGSEILDGIRLSDSVVDFKQVRSIEDFSVLVNGLVINSELPKFLLTKYFELCCSQKSFLHEHLLEGLNCKLAAGMISETINVADAIRACKISTSQESLSTWDKTLKAFEVLGMNVGFLRARLEQLLNISLKLKRYKEATLVRAQAEEEVQTLEAKLLEVKEKINSLDAEIENLDVAADKLELAFQEVANAPW
ncbi:B3 domain-containing protein Os01g0234100 [Quercus suber]|uniref:B3 domain-containing protein Os01g0234100 n=1 Tax=Quercus suber TaxID=58331 RepID=UPI0032E00E9C